MRGTLHKTESGWQVWYHAKEDLFYGNTGVRILPILDHGYVNGPGLSDSDEGQEVEFKVIEFPVPPTNGPVSNSISKYAQLVDKATRPLTEDDTWPEYIPYNSETRNWDKPVSLLHSIRANPSWETIIREFHLATQQVEIGAPPLIFECWLVENYNPPTKKQE